MSHENTDLCNNPFVALFGSISQFELYKTSVEDATKAGMYIMRILIFTVFGSVYNVCGLCFLLHVAPMLPKVSGAEGLSG